MASILTATDETDHKRDQLLLREAFETAAQPYVTVGLSGLVLGSNAAWRELYGTKDALPARLDPLLDSEAAAEWQQQLALLGQDSALSVGLADREDLTATHAPYGRDVQSLTIDAAGDAHVVQLQATPLHNLEGKIDQILVGFQDVTGRALEVENSRTIAVEARRVLDAVEGAVVLQDETGAIADVFLGAHRLFGAAATELLGQPALPEGWRPLNSETADLANTTTTLQVQLAGQPVRHVQATARGLTAGDEADRSPRKRCLFATGIRRKTL